MTNLVSASRVAYKDDVLLNGKVDPVVLKARAFGTGPLHEVAAQQPAARDAGADGAASRMSGNQLREQA